MTISRTLISGVLSMRFLLIAILILSCGYTWGNQESNPGLPISKITKGSNQSHIKPDDNKNAPEKASASSVPNVTTANQNEKGNGDTSKDNQEYEKPFWENARDDPTAAATIAIAILTFFLIVIGGCQAWQMRRTVNAMREEFASTHRPRIILREAYAVRDSGLPITVCYTLANTGGTSARIVESALDVKFELPSCRLHLGPVSAGKNDIGNIEIKAGAHEAKECIFQNTNWTNALVASYCYFSGHIVYEDTAGILRHAAFYRSYDDTTSRFLPINDPQLEYCDERP